MKQDFGKEEEGVGGGTRPERVFLSLLGDLEGSGENEETGEMRKPGRDIHGTGLPGLHDESVLGDIDTVDGCKERTDFLGRHVAKALQKTK